MKTIEINHQPVELFKLLKFEGLCDSGGQAKALIADGHVAVNAETETRKRRKINAGDTIEFDGETYRVVLQPPASVDSNGQT
jgi:ribosome-associated protein